MQDCSCQILEIVTVSIDILEMLISYVKDILRKELNDAFINISVFFFLFAFLKLNTSHNKFIFFLIQSVVTTPIKGYASLQCMQQVRAPKNGTFAQQLKQYTHV